MTLNCFKCHAEVVFDSEHIGKNGKKIPLDPATHAPHDCPMREKPTRVIEEEKDDHGNETVYDMAPPKEEYVDHTAKGQSKVKIFSGSDQFLENKYNEFLANNQGKIKTQGAQFQVIDSITYAIALYYEEIKQ